MYITNLKHDILTMTPDSMISSLSQDKEWENTGATKNFRAFSKLTGAIFVNKCHFMLIVEI